MRNLFQLLMGLLLALAIGKSAMAQTNTHTSKSPEINVIIHQREVRFAATGEAQEWRLEIHNQTGEAIYDSGSVNGADIVWPLQNENGQTVTSGLYAYTLTIKGRSAETEQVRRGHLIVDLAKGRDAQADRLWITSQSIKGAGGDLGGSEVVVARDNESAIAGLRSNAAMTPPSPVVRGSGTVNRITKWTATDEIGDSVIAESGGNIGVGTASPTEKLQVAGIVHSTNGGVKFPDGSVQTTAASGGVASVTASAPLASSGGTTPNVSLTGVILVANGGTGSATQNFVDLSTTQTVAGDKTFSNAVNTTAQYNIGGLRVISIPGADNLFAGIGAGANNTSGGGNSFFGREAGVSNTTGSVNSFFGAQAGFSNNGGGSNSFFGSGAGFNNTSGNSNSFFGRDVGYNNSTGGGNSFFGHGAGSNNTTANSNSFFGFVAGEKNTIGADNSFFGAGSGANNSIGGGNSFFGREAGVLNTTGSLNSFFGTSAGFSNDSGESNSFFGSGAGHKNTSGFGNSFFGRESGFNNTTGFYNSFFGNGAGGSTTTGNHNAFVGIAAGGNNTEGTNNSFFGRGSGNNNTTGSYNTIIGMEAGLSNTSESANTFIGVQANGAAGINNATAIGAGASVTQSDSVVLGNNANVGIGVTAPQARLDVRNGNIYLGTAGQGVVLKSPNGSTCRLLTIDDTGAIVLSAIACP